MSAGRKRATASATVRAGGDETRRRVVRAYGRTATGGLYTSRGPALGEHGIEYKPYNEDAAVLGVIPASRTRRGQEIVFAGAFDQAGGMGQIPGQTGGASKLIAEAVAEAAFGIAAGDEPHGRLEAAALTSHRAINALNHANRVEAVTTASFGVVMGGAVYVVNCGDSKAYRFSREGEVLAETRSHNLSDETAARMNDPNAGLQFSNIITASLGGEGRPELDHYTWEVAPGDLVLFVSDGVSDANLEAQRAAIVAQAPWDEHNTDVTANQLAPLVAGRDPGWVVARRVSEFALRKMVKGDAKPDNISCVAVRMSQA